MTTEQLAVALKELTVEVARLTARVAELEDTYGKTLDEHGNRLWKLERELEHQGDANYTAQQELSAHLNGMTYP